MPTRYVVVTLPLLLTLWMTGCRDSRHSLSEDEWDQVFAMPADNTEAARHLVENDSESRNQWLELHDDLQQERSEIGRQRDLLEQDRQQWRQRDRTDPIIAEAIATFGLLLACVMPLLLAFALASSQPSEPTTESTCEVLIEDLTAERPRLVSPQDGGVSKRR